MKILSLLPCLGLALIGSGCSTPGHPLFTSAGGAGGAALANTLSHGDAGATAAGALSGVLLSEGLLLYHSKTEAKAYTRGYVLGRSDAVKTQYWIQQRQQQVSEAEPRFTLWPIPIPAQEIDGVQYQPATRVLTIHQ